MKNRKKKTVKAQALVFSLLLLIALTYSVPAKASDTNVLVRNAYAQIDGRTKNDFKNEYQLRKKSVKKEYRKTVNALKAEYAQVMSSNRSKGDRIEARKKFKEGLKVAQEKMNAALKEAKESYKKQISQ